jgi:hypothetical protein
VSFAGYESSEYFEVSHLFRFLGAGERELNSFIIIYHLSNQISDYRSVENG